MDRIQRRRVNTRLKYKFNITLAEYEYLLNQQDYKCAICKSGINYHSLKEIKHKLLSVDHCHTTNKVRGILCMNCNTALGHFKDNIQILTNAIHYLETEVILPENIEEDSSCLSVDDIKRWRRITFTPKGIFSNSTAAANHYKVHESTMLNWCGILKNPAKKGFSSIKLSITNNEIKQRYKTVDI